MDFNLRCNSLDCRTVLDHLAVVTTCSHIFCSSCADNLLLKQATSSRHLGAITPTCPACHTELKNPDDIVKTNLNPTDDYKTSVLSGLSPNLILEIAGRGISFWMYQTTQEIVYQEYLSKTLSEKFSTLSTQLDNVIHEANTEIKALRDKLQAVSLENETISRKNHELGEALREKSRKQLQIQEKYDQLRRKSLVSHVKLAATHSVNKSLNDPLTGRVDSPHGFNRLSNIPSIPVIPARQNQQERVISGGMQLADRERLTLPSGNGSTGRGEGSFSDGNSDTGRQGTKPLRNFPLHGRTGSAGTGSRAAAASRENLGAFTTPLNTQNHRQQVGPMFGGESAEIARPATTQTWKSGMQKLNMQNGVPKSFQSQRQALNEMSANIGVGRSRFGVEDIQGPRSSVRPVSRQFLGTAGIMPGNGIYIG
ncbi:hypothetical protein H072_2637 [Dactylellina haptotyla CBS 200.50]|uniref:RING-type domain-containing protein n=1 Tax=Dactylellina haptotyla (strain CBS 200.50) TaxID=1284197 RepID=S8AKH5_DACHA|nr:hypothetical protein H072_2637 [Dactylellina haptotyla CBS 200.50]